MNGYSWDFPSDISLLDIYIFQLRDIRVSTAKSSTLQSFRQKGGGNHAQSVHSAGNLGGDPEVFYSSEGNPVAFSGLEFDKDSVWDGLKIHAMRRQKIAQVKFVLPR